MQHVQTPSRVRDKVEQQVACIHRQPQRPAETGSDNGAWLQLNKAANMKKKRLAPESPGGALVFEGVYATKVSDKTATPTAGAV